jgi:hypothetical protein
MTIPFLTGGADPNHIKGIQESLQGIFDPKQPARNALQLAMAGNQQLNQQWQDKYAVDKEGMERMFGRRVHELFATGQQSAEGAIAHEAATAVANDVDVATLDAGGVRRQGAAMQLTGKDRVGRAQAQQTLANSVSQGKLQDQAIAEGEANAPWLTQMAEARATIAQNNATIGTDQVRQGAQQAAYDTRAQELMAAAAVDATGRQRTPEEMGTFIFETFKKGSIPPPDMAALLAHEPTRRIFEAQMTMDRDRANYQRSLWLQNNASKLSYEELLQRSELGVADDYAKASMGQFGVDTFRTLLRKPELVRELLNTPQPPANLERRNMWEAVQYMKQYRTDNATRLQSEAVRMAETSTERERAILANPNSTFEQKTLAAKTINDVEKAVLGARGLTYNVYTPNRDVGYEFANIVPGGDPFYVGAPTDVQTVQGGSARLSVEQAAQTLNNGGTLEQLKTAGYSPAEIAQIQTIAAQLKAKKP